MAAWARRVGARQSKEFDNIEITEKLPDGWEVKKKVLS
jgi:UDP-glucose 4-epimerase